MAKVLLKKSSVASNEPDSSDLSYGELAINYTDGKLYYKNSSNQIQHFSDAAITKDYIDANDSSLDALKMNRAGDVMTGLLDMSGNRIQHIATPISDSDAANKAYVDAAAAVKVNRSGDTMTGVLNMGTNRIISVSDPANAQDAATKKYVDDTVAAGVGAVEYPDGDYGLVDSAGAIDAFGVFISISAYDHMDPSGSLVTIDHGTDSSI